MVRAPLALLLLVTSFHGWAEVAVTNPGISDRETLVYVETVGPETRPYTVTLAAEGSGPDARIDFHILGADIEALYRLDPKTLLSLASEQTVRGTDATVRRTAEYRSLKASPGAADLVVTDMGCLPVLLRGFPWDRTGYARILYLGNTAYGGSGVSFELQVTGKDQVAAAGRTWECWHAVTGIGGALGFVIPKTDWWFAVEGTHPLVKTSGPAGGPGSPTRTLVLQSWQTGASP